VACSYCTRTILELAVIRKWTFQVEVDFPCRRSQTHSTARHTTRRTSIARRKELYTIATNHEPVVSVVGKDISLLHLRGGTVGNDLLYYRFKVRKKMRK
jgi:hypothetical protein